MSVRLIRGDCREVMAAMEAESVDAIVCDPPYGLTSGSGIGGFMGMAWDHGVPGVPFWSAARHVLKPGGYLIAFGGTRTYHRLAVAIEDAGFEIRDGLMWLYGSGFPKSMDVSKAIDKAAGAEREVIGTGPFASRRPRADHEQQGITFADDSYVRPAGHNVTAPATPEAAEWAGWGTALKPAWEPIILARKPLSKKTVAANVLAYGTGGINVDGCRIGTGGTVRSNRADMGYHGGLLATEYTTGSESGRWPANVILSHAADCEPTVCTPDCPVRLLDEQSGEAGGGFGTRGTGGQVYGASCSFRGDGRVVGFGDTGGASRFFYCAKASSAERNRGLDAGANTHPTVKPLDLMRWLVKLVTPPGGRVLDPFCGSGSTLVAAVEQGFNATGIDLDESGEYLAIARGRLGLLTDFEVAA